MGEAMMTKRTIWIVAVAAVMLVSGMLAGPALSQDESAVPTAREVVNSYLAAVGGEEAIRAHTVRVMEGTMEVPGQGMSAEIKIKAMAPNKTRMHLTIAGMGTIEGGFDGEVGWMINPMAGPMIQEGKELAQAKRQADYYADLHGDHLYKSMTNTGQAEFEGKPCWKVELVTPDDEKITEYFSIETGLIEGSDMTQESPMGPVTVTTVISDYKEFGGVLSPTRIAAQIGPGMTQVITIKSIAFEGVTEADFDLPAAIKTLVGGGEAEAEAVAEEAPVPAAPENLHREE